MSQLKQLKLSPRKMLVVVLAWILTVAIASLDYFTGRDFALSPYYLVPVCWVAWVAGRRAGIWLGVASALAWFLSDRMTGYVYEHALTPYWNAVMFLILFLFVIQLISAFQTAHYHLEETVQRRTAALQAEIQERQRLEADKLRAERLATVGTMAAQVAHEVRNPLGSITLNLDLIQREINKLAAGAAHSTEEGLELVVEIREEIHRIQGVIEDYLHFARLPKLKPEPIALNEFLEQKLAFLDSELEGAGVKLRTHFDPALPMISADAGQLWQALLNLIRNSREAMPGGGEMTIGTWRNGTEALLRVSDTGNGMTAEQLNRVFEPFFTTKRQGTGLGLALVQQIVSEHGGRVECESAGGKGTTFTIFLPLPAPDTK